MALRVYKANLIVSLPGTTPASCVHVQLNLKIPSDAHHEEEIQLGPSDVSVHLAPLDGTSANVNGHGPPCSPESTSLPAQVPPAATPAIGVMTSHQPALSPAAAPAWVHVPAPLPSTSNGPQPATQIPYDPRQPLPLIPTDRLAAPLSRPPEDEAAVKEFVGNALKEARQFSGSRPSPLTQIDRLVARVRLFCHLHGLRTFGPRNTTIYWSDLLKFGGMGTAWNEKKSGRRAYKHIYADLLAHQDHPLIVPLLDDERGKPLDVLEGTLDAINGRSPHKSAPPAAAATLLPTKKAEIEEPPENALLDLAENDHPTAGPSKKRKREVDEVVTMPEIHQLPLMRLTAPSSRSNEEETAVKQGIINELVQTGQWSGTRPSVINSLNVLIGRINTLIRVHSKETIGEPKVTVYWTDCIRYGGVSQAWSSKKAGKAAFRTTYTQLLRYKEHPTIQALLLSSNSIDIRAAESALAKLSESGGATPAPAPSTLSVPSEATLPGTTTPIGRRRSTPEWSASPEPVNYSEILEGRLTPLASSETTQKDDRSISNDDEVDELADGQTDGSVDSRPAKLPKIAGEANGEQATNGVGAGDETVDMELEGLVDPKEE